MRRPTLIAHSVGGGQPNLSQDDLRQLRTPALSLAKQRSIVDSLDGDTVKSDSMVAKIEAVIEWLHGFRFAIIIADCNRQIIRYRTILTTVPFRR